MWLRRLWNCPRCLCVVSLKWYPGLAYSEVQFHAAVCACGVAWQASTDHVQNPISNQTRLQLFSSCSAQSHQRRSGCSGECNTPILLYVEKDVSYLLGRNQIRRNDSTVTLKQSTTAHANNARPLTRLQDLVLESSSLCYTEAHEQSCVSVSFLCISRSLTVCVKISVAREDLHQSLGFCLGLPTITERLMRVLRRTLPKSPLSAPLSTAVRKVDLDSRCGNGFTTLCASTKLNTIWYTCSHHRSFPRM